MEQGILISRLCNLASGKWYGTFPEDMLTTTLGTELGPARHKDGGQACHEDGGQAHDLLTIVLTSDSDRPVHL